MAEGDTVIVGVAFLVERSPNTTEAGQIHHLLEVITDRKVPVLPMVPAGYGLHEFLVYDEAKEKDRKEVMRKRNVDFAVNYRD
ncbi:Thiamine pyrophosphate enzyme C-terminal TPP-binding [Penicillium waksmanii]|uniref:Thiamine pyrophosphate enzyme C-terminal TPP-binding n=1 Tax=Penicillium waksmanii TaxID=69791 RepID=UPI0025465FB6|nr:Thiamine pyrophosphate enzyme C-terminal TPP-binding [Penicillium waksmanii]KAJ5974924.1 Thiamine pyrophosphate enzyme C-terminal TPP-binding [Penicillium waksmanii]